MDLSTVKLDTGVLARLYHKSLVAGNELVSDPAPAPPKSLAFLGNNKKNIIIVVTYPHVQFIPDAELTFLTNMLSACKLSLGDVAIVNLGKNEGPDYKELNAQLNGTVHLLFGISPATISLPIDFPAFQVQSLNHSVFLYTPPLAEISDDKILKSKLWVCLQRIFQL